MDVWRQLKGAWSNLNQANKQVWDEFYANGPQPVDKTSPSSLTTSAGRGKMAGGLIVNTLINEQLKKPMQAELDQAKKNWQRMSDRRAHYQKGGALAHPPAVEL